MSWASYIPEELSVQPLPLVILTGLDIKHNAVHKEIWNGFNSRSNLKFRYLLLDGDHEYPRAKSKRSLEVYTEKGILKTNWFNKHLYNIPSLVVVFFDLEWDEPNWKEKQMECATKVELVKQSLHDRNTKVILILIQKKPNLPVDNENGLARERYPSLCNACGIKTNYLYLLHAEYLQGYILKLEDDAFTEPAQSYYNQEIKAIKLKRDSLIKVTHQYLLVRLSIKIAFFNETKQDILKAIENYKLAYQSILDIRSNDPNVLEIKLVAGIINYKLCKLLFEIKHPLDAIEQFRKHIDIFKVKIGPIDLNFEHSAWLAKQFQIMGELFDNAFRKEYVSAVQTQHPGFYFHSAATHTIQRRVHLQELLKSKNFTFKQHNSENPSPIELLNNLEYFGQRPWRQGNKATEILDQQKETEALACLIELESKENLSPLVASLFKQAIFHFKQFNCRRMKQYLSVCMAEEYFDAKDYQESLNIYINVLNDYNNEHWWPILTSIIFNALKCAYLVSDIQNYCLLCVEIIGKNILLSDEIKSNLQKNLIRVISNEVPIGEYHQINTDKDEDISQKWLDEFSRNVENNSMNNIISANVVRIVPFVDCKAQFCSAIFNSNEFIDLKVYFRTECVDPIQFNKLSICFNLPNYNPNCIIDDKKKLYFEPNKIYEIKFNFLPEKSDVGRDLEITSISLELGGTQTRSLVLNWTGECKNALKDEHLTINTFNKLSHSYKQIDDSLEPDWEQINIVPLTSIVSRKAKIDIGLDHKSPILVNEYYPIRITILNNEESVIENLSMSVEILPINAGSDLDAPISSIDSEIARIWIEKIDKDINELEQTRFLPNLDSNQEINKIVFIQINEMRPFYLSIKVKYTVDVLVRRVNFTNETELKRKTSGDSDKNEFGIETKNKKIIKCSCVQENKIRLEPIQPFSFNVKCLSMQLGEINLVRYGEPFFVLCDIKNETPFSLKFKNSSLLINKFVKFKSEENESLLKDEILNSENVAPECFCIVAEPDSDGKKIFPGELVLEWKRIEFGSVLDQEINEDDLNNEKENDDSTSAFNTVTKYVLPQIPADKFPFLIEPNLPSYGWLGKELIINYEIKNKLEEVLEMECTLEENEYFGIAGKKLELMQIMPFDTSIFSFMIYPLKVGHCELPSFHVKVQSPLAYSEAVKKQESDLHSSYSFDSVIKNMIPSLLFIFPEKIESILKES